MSDFCRVMFILVTAPFWIPLGVVICVVRMGRDIGHDLYGWMDKLK